MAPPEEGCVCARARLMRTRAVVQAHSEMALLKAQADKEQSVFEVEWRELGKVCEPPRFLGASVIE